MCLILLEAVSKPVQRRQLIGRRKVSLDHTSAVCRLHRGGVVSFVVVTGGVPPVSVASHILQIVLIVHKPRCFENIFLHYVRSIPCGFTHNLANNARD